MIPKHYDFTERKCLNCIYYTISNYKSTFYLTCKIVGDNLRKEWDCIPFNTCNNCPYFEANEQVSIMGLVDKIVEHDLKDEDEIRMTWATDDNGEKTVYNYDENRWEYPDSDGYENINGKKKRICQRCGKPSLDINGVCDVDFCMQALTQCSFITAACCGHNNDDEAYISLADGRRFILDKEWSRK